MERLIGMALYGHSTAKCGSGALFNHGCPAASASEEGLSVVRGVTRHWDLVWGIGSGFSLQFDQALSKHYRERGSQHGH